jgi:hypothetical protein
LLSSLHRHKLTIADESQSLVQNNEAVQDGPRFSFMLGCQKNAPRSPRRLLADNLLKLDRGGCVAVGRKIGDGETQSGQIRDGASGVAHVGGCLAIGEGVFR